MHAPPAQLNLQRISTSLKMLAALGSWVGVVTSWEHPQASLEVAGLILLLCYSPSLAMQARGREGGRVGEKRAASFPTGGL